MKLLVFLLSIPLYTACPPFEYVKELSRGFKPEYQHLSPLGAMVALQTDQLKRLLQTGDPQRASTQLLGNLFKIQDNRLYHQNNLSKPTAHFNPEIIADIVAGLEKKIYITPAYQTTWQKTLRAKINSELKKKSQGHMTTAKLNAFLKILQEVHHECSHIKTGLTPALPYTALLGYLCLKYTAIDDLVVYFESLQRNGMHVFTTTNVHDMAYDHFTVADRKTFHVSDDIIGMIKRDRSLYEAALFTEVDTTYYRGILPPMARESNVNFDGIQARDCLNTAIRTFFDHIFYDREACRFDPIKKLPPTITPSRELLDFYHKYSYPAYVNESATIAYDWMKLLANRPNIVYHGEHNGQRFEVCARGGISNILTILNQLLNVQHATFQELCKLLSTEQRSLLSSYTKQEDRERLHITIQDSGEKPYTLSFELAHEHGFMRRSTSLENPQCTDYKKSMRNMLLAQLSCDTYDQDAHNLLSVYLSQNPKDLTEDIREFVTNKNIPYDNLIAFYSLIDVDVGNNDLIVFESICSKLKQYPSLKHFLSSLIFDLDEKDSFYYYYNIKFLAKYQVWEIDTEYVDSIIKLLGKIHDERYIKKAITILEKYKAYMIPRLHDAMQVYKKEAPV